MNNSSVVSAKMRKALLSTTAFCLAGFVLPSVATAVPVIEHISGGDSVAAGDYVFESGVIIENPGSSFSGWTVRVWNDSEMLVRDRAKVSAIELQLGGFDGLGHTGRLNVTSGGTVRVSENIVFTRRLTGRAELSVSGAGSAVYVDGNIDTDGYDRLSSTISLFDGGRLSVGGNIHLVSDPEWESYLYIGSEGNGAAGAAGYLDASVLSLNGNNTYLVLNHTGTFQFNGDLSGSGNVLAMSGQSILAGENQWFNGVISISESASVQVDGTVRGYVDLNGGYLSGSGQVAIVRIGSTVSTTIRPETSTPRIGRLDIGEASTLKVIVDPSTGASGTFNVTGKAVIGEGAVVQHVAGTNNDFLPDASYTIINANQGIEGRFSGIESDFAFLDASLDYTANTVVMNLTRNDINFADIGVTPNQRAVGGAIQGIQANQNIANLVVGLDEDAARLGFTQMAGELHASARSAMQLDAANLRQTLIGSVAANDASGQPYGVWGRALGSSTKLNGRDGNAELKSDATGFVAGIDKAFGSAMRAGVMVGFEQADMKSKGLGEIDRDSQHLGVYGRGDWGHLNVQTGAIASWHSLSSKRDLAFGNTAENLKGDYDATSAQAYVEAAWAVPMAWATVSPYASLAYNYQDVDAVQETGGVAALSIDSSDQNLTTAGLGVAVKKTWERANGRAATISGRLGWESYSGDLDAVQNTAFADSADFEIVGLSMGDDAVVAGLGVAVPVGKAGTVALDWTGLKGSEQRRNALAVSYRLTF